MVRIIGKDYMNKIEEYGYVDFKMMKEAWSEYTLEDGTIVKTRAILFKVKKEDEGYSFNEKSFAASFSPAELRGPKGSSRIQPNEIENILESIKKEDVDILITKEHWNEYELSSGDKFSSKAVLVSASLTDRYDDIGDPIYAVQLQVLHKIIPKRK